jgi:hypothetical protein
MMSSYSPEQRFVLPQDYERRESQRNPSPIDRSLASTVPVQSINHSVDAPNPAFGYNPVFAQKCIWRWNWTTDDDPG